MDRETGAEHPIFLKKLLRREVKGKMAAIDLTKYGITGTVEIVHNPSYELLFEEETKPGLEGSNSSLWTRIPRTPCGGPPMSIRTTTIPLPKRPGMW